MKIKILKVHVDCSPNKAKCGCAYYQPLFNQIYIIDDYLKENIGTIDMIHTIIHEYTHDRRGAVHPVLGRHRPGAPGL